MKIVLDTNVLISALIKTGKPRTLLSKISQRKALIISRGILSEFLTVAKDAKIKRYVKENETPIFLNALLKGGELVKVTSRFKVVVEDPADDVILRTAFDGKADYVVSGDKHLL
jgi:putative PIN family toxin of toxin-antitoxin system